MLLCEVRSHSRRHIAEHDGEQNAEEVVQHEHLVVRHRREHGIRLNLHARHLAQRRDMRVSLLVDSTENNDFILYQVFVFKHIVVRNHHKVGVAVFDVALFRSRLLRFSVCVFAYRHVWQRVNHVVVDVFVLRVFSYAAVAFARYHIAESPCYTVAFIAEERASHFSEAVVDVVVVGEFAREHSVVEARYGIDEIFVLALVVARSLEDKVDDEHLRVAFVYVHHAVGNLASVVQFGHIHQHDVVVYLLHAAAVLYFVEHVSHREVAESLLHRVHHCEVYRREGEQPTHE